MHRAVFLGLGLGACLAAGAAHGQVPPGSVPGGVPGSVIDALRGDRWADADAAAAPLPDPVARKLALYYRLLAPGAARAVEIAAFMADNPDWPSQATLSHRLQEALATDGDDRAVLAICQARPPQTTPSLLRCADADAQAGRLPDALETARQAWIGGITDPPGELAFLKTWGRQLTFADQWRRFDRLAWADNGAVGGPAFRQIARIDAAQRPAAEARLALKRDDASALALVRALPAGARADPGLLLDWAKWLRRAGQDDDAVTLWLTAGAVAERAAPPEHRAAFWDERNLLARRRLHNPDARDAYALVNQLIPDDPAQAGDAHFLAGFIALRRLADPAAAAAHFHTLAASSSAITQARAHYWAARTLDAQQAASQAEYQAAAAWPTTYYGQLAARALGEDEAALAQRIVAARDPGWNAAEAIDLAGRELSRAAALLVEWGDPRRARAFVLRLDELASDPAGHSLAARLAAGFGMPDLAVAIARRAGARGTMMPDAGWPLAVDPPKGSVEPALALGLIRQESNFDAQAASPVGARGLMQLMPATAAVVARKLGEPASVPALTADPEYNMRLGTAYAGGLLDRFGGAIPYAVAGYNAGPSRVLDWLAANGDPQNPGGPDMIDWIELIPFNETRNYVQRVIENVVVYRARLGVHAPHPLARWQG